MNLEKIVPRRVVRWFRSARTHLRRLWNRLNFGYATRYKALYGILSKANCCNVLEIGVARGENAVRMLKALQERSGCDKIEYTGVDLFDSLTEEYKEKEGSIDPDPQEVVAERLEQAFRGSNVEWRLFQGDSKMVLPKLLDEGEEYDLIVIDGGHSASTVSSDWQHAQALMAPEARVVFDDYVRGDALGRPEFGVNEVVDGISKNAFHINFLKPVDVFSHEWGVLETQMVVVERRNP